MKQTTVFFPRLKSVHRGEEGYLENQHYEVKSAEHERGDSTTQDVLLSSVSPQALLSQNIVYSWKDPSTVSLGTMALTHKYVRIARLDADAKLIIILRSSREKSCGKVRKIKIIAYYYHSTHVSR